MPLRSNGWVRDRDAEALVQQMASSGQPSLSEMGVMTARAYIDARASAAPAGPPVDDVHGVRIPSADGSIAARVYQPAVDGPVPTVVYFHGGGWVVGSVAASDAFCRRVVDAVPCALISVDYRLAPEHRFPAGVRDAVAALEWAADRGAATGDGPQQVIALGDSAGGNLAAGAIRHLVGRGQGIVARQILAYPGVAAEPPGLLDAPPYGWPLSHADMAWFRGQYTDDDKRNHPDVSPLMADAAGMPPTTLLLGGCDPLLAEGVAYAEHLAAAGVSVDLHLYTGQIHGFLTMDPTILPRSREALGVVANAIRGQVR